MGNRRTSHPQFSPQRKVILFSALFFCVILAGGSAAFLFAMRQMIRNETLGQLSRIIETRNLQFTTAFDSQISLAVNMAESPLIRSHLGNPGNAELARLAFAEFSAHRKSFSGNNIFWISDIDKRYYFNDKYSYTLDPSDPENAWYAPTLNQKDRYSFNVNFDIGIERTLCWINVPVYHNNKTPVGIVGTGIDLTDYINILFTGLGDDVTLFLFNSLGEITGAKDISFMERKSLISDVWETSGRQVFFEAQSVKEGASKTFIINDKAYAVSKIPRLNWYIAVSRPMTVIMFLNNAMFVFIALIAVILLIFLVFNIYISNILKPINLMLERMQTLSAEWKKSSHSLRIRQVIFVCFAFILMMVISFTATNIIMRRHLAYEAQELLRDAELTIASNLREAVTALIDSSFSIRYMIERGANQGNLHRYLVDVTDWLMGNKELVYGFNGIYGYIRGEYMDGTNWEPPPDYVPQERPWFKAAKEKRGELAETVPYVDSDSGEIVISYSQEIFDSSEKSLGVLAIDILLDQVGEYVETIRLSETGYGILLNQNFEIIASPDDDHKGKRLDSINSGYASIHAMLVAGNPVVSLGMTDAENIKHIAFFKRLSNGWYIGSMTPFNVFYRDTYIMALILALVGFALMFVLSLLILRQHRRIENYTDAVMELNEASRRFVPTQFVKIIGVENITSLKLGDSVQNIITVMFFDIRFFSVHSQMMSTNETFDFVNKVFGLAGGIIRKTTVLLTNIWETQRWFFLKDQSTR